MIGPGRGSLAGEAALAGLVLVAAAAFAQARPERLSWLVVVPVLAAIPFRLARFHPAARRVVERTTWTALAAVGLVVLNWLVSPAGQGQPAPPLPAAVGYGLTFLSALFLALRPALPPARTTVPVALGTLVVAASQSGVSLRTAAALAALASVALLVNAGGAGGVGRGRALRVAFFFAAAAAVAGGLAWLLPWLQPQVVQAVARNVFAAPESSVSFETRLGDLEELRLSPRVALRVWTDRPRKLRAAVATAFDGRRWRAEPPAHPQPLPLAASAAETEAAGLLGGVAGATFRVPHERLAGDLVSTRVLQAAPVEGALVAPQGVVLVRAPLERVLVGEGGVLGPSAAVGTVYGTLSRPRPDPSRDPRGPLTVPPDTDPRILELAARLAAEALPTPEGRVARTVAFLRHEYRYSLRVGRFRSRQPLAEFLFVKKQGWCQYFASAAALLLRLQGVPTRLVTGFQLRPELLRGGHYVVREADAHAWIEAWLPGTGWVEADPTPAAGYAAAHGEPGGGGLAAAWEWLRGAVSRAWAAEWRAVPAVLGEELRAAFREPWMRVGIVVACLVALGLRARAAWRRRSRRAPAAAADAPPAPPELARLLARLDRAWARQGAPRPPSRGPLEHLEGAAGSRLPAPLRETSRRAVEAYYGARFGGAPIAPPAIAALEREIREAAPSRR